MINDKCKYNNNRDMFFVEFQLTQYMTIIWLGFPYKSCKLFTKKKVINL